ncbi:MAG TPA: glycosyltransferase [Candidatus Saccharimonadales bacterium]|nr:glycosyltransferase [Candidatus Saccharimonadales bacterium]
MRVLQLNIHYSGSGADRCAHELYEDLPSVGIQTAMWVSDRNPGDSPDVRALRFPWERWLLPLETFPDLTDWRHLGSIRSLQSISKKDFDLVHIHIIHSGWISIRAVRELTERIPCVWTLHDEWAPNRGITCDLTGKITAADVKRLSRGPIRYIPYHRYHENFKWRRTRRFLESWMPEPQAVICPSRYMADLAQTSGVFPHSKIVHIPNGTRMPDNPAVHMDRNEARRSFGLSPNQPVVLMVSADLAQAHKGIDLGIRAIKEINPNFGTQVLLLGRAGQQITDALRPIPAVSVCAADDATLARAYRAADITIIPSLADNFPYIGLESLSCGTPLVSFPVSGMPEMIGKNERGIVCSAIDAAEMSLHLRRLIADSEFRQQAGARGSAWVKENCGMRMYLNKIAQLYRQVLSGEPASIGAFARSKIE